MSEKIEDLLAEFLLDNNEGHSAEESLLIYLVMEPFISQFRSKGMSNKDILNLCKQIDESRDNEYNSR